MHNASRFFLYTYLIVGAQSHAFAVNNNLSSHLQNLQAEYLTHVASQPADTFKPSNQGVKLINPQNVMIEITVHNQAQVPSIIDRLKQAGLTQISSYKKNISVAFPIVYLKFLQDVPEISWVTSGMATRRVGPPGGAAFNAADPAMFADLIKKQYAIDGSSTVIGVLSDSYNCLGGAQLDVETGDLPDDVEVLKEYPFCDTDGTDEGRAMMQLIHDVAPGAKLLFHTAFISATDFAQGIQRLAEAGADVIVDDVGYFDMPMFQDGPIAQSVNEAKAKGVSYFSSAGNDARLSYEKPFTPAREFFSYDYAHDFGTAAGQSPDFYQPITIPTGTPVMITLQWDDPAEVAGGTGAQSDIDLFLLDHSQSLIVSSSQDSNIGHNPVERIGIINNSDITDFYLYISHRAGPAPSHIKYVLHGPPAPWPIASYEIIQLNVNTNGASPVIVMPDGSPLSGGTAVVIVPAEPPLSPRLLTIGTESQPIQINSNGEPVVNIGSTSYPIGPGGLPIWFVPDGYLAVLNEEGNIELLLEEAQFVPVSINRYATHSSTIYGHPNAAGAMAVGAIPYKQTPWFGIPLDKGTIEYFSSAGGTPIFFNPDGTRLATQEVRFKPEIIAPDDIDTTFFGGADTDNNGWPNFQGTSAAAPNAAALAALLIDAFPFITPDEVYHAMTKGSLDLYDPAALNEPTPINGACATNTQFDWGTGCGLIQADLVFNTIENSNDAVQLVVRTSAHDVTPGKDFTYLFDILNLTDKTLTNPQLHALQLPRGVVYKKIDGCLSIDSQEASCLLPELLAGQRYSVTVTVATQNNPPDHLVFDVDLLTDTFVDLSEAHVIQKNPVIVLPGDFNTDGCIDVSDYGILFGVLRTGSSDQSSYDLTGDGLVTLDDLSALESSYSLPGGAYCY